MIVGLAMLGLTEPLVQAEELFTCVPESELDKDVASDAELVDFSCLFKKWEGQDTLHFKVAIKNVSNKAQRFRVLIFLDNGKAVGGLIPRKVKAGLVQPGQTASFVYPVNKMPSKPKNITLIIATASS
jgi:hypothetical protein